ncbi:hypothetical protein NC653_025547 [Populus alba x Populus x berolinensis]|uniref:ER membrane protein complex subunit 6 n=1 Tax=Populus alba x Populus x berolinensis TaxID=444605 RepID=A0AAD6MBU6_9ROSI|nr:hypothetical protein NC653_025547 [Populus alba x Populus x berolinensis]
MVVYVNGVCLKEFELAIDLKKCKANRILDLSDYLKVEAMAGHNESEKKSSDAVNDLQTFRAENLQSNMKVIYYSRTFLSIIGGVIAGILGLTGLTGFVFYFLMMTITSVALIAKAKFSIHTYFDSWNRVLLDGFLGGLMSFVLFWTGRTWMLLGTDSGKHLASKNRI